MTRAEIDPFDGDQDRSEPGFSAADPSQPWVGGAGFSFMASPEALADWRMVLAYEAAAGAGALGVLPGTAAEIAARCDLDQGALHAVLGQLAAFGIVAADDQGGYVSGPQAPVGPEEAMLLWHGAAIRQWGALLDKRLRDRTAASGEAPAGPPIDDWLDLLAVNARRLTGPVVDACLERFPHAMRVLDLGGGHGEHSFELARRGLRPTMQDRPEVIEIAKRRGQLADSGVELFAGDFFEALPPGPFDLVLLGGITNMFDAATNRDLYRRLRPIVAPGGGLAIVTYLRGRNPVAASFALHMLVVTERGDAHGEDDYRCWLAEAGYEPPQLRDLDNPPQTIVLAAAHGGEREGASDDLSPREDAT